MKQCKYCKEEINNDATLCLHCKCYQNWRGVIPLSSSFLAMVIAFFSVLSITLPVIASTVRGKHSDIHSAFRGVGGGAQTDERTFLMTIWNEGTRAGELTEVYLEFQVGQASLLRLDLYDRSGLVYVEPGNLQRLALLVLRSDREKIRKERLSRSDIQCRIFVYGFDFNGRRAQFNAGDETIDTDVCKSVLASY